MQNFRIRFHGGMACDVTDVLLFEKSKDEYVFWSSDKSDSLWAQTKTIIAKWILKLLANEPILRAPLTGVSHIQNLGEPVDSSDQDDALANEIEAAIPPEGQKEAILKAGKNQAGRFLARLEKGEVTVYDTTDDKTLVAHEKFAPLVDALVDLANKQATDDAMKRFEDGREENATIKFIIEDIDQKPTIAIARAAWDQMLAGQEYRVVGLPVAKDASGRDWHFDIKDEGKQVTLTRCNLIVNSPFEVRTVQENAETS